MKILAIDWGGKRIGTAIGTTEIRLPRPYLQIPNDTDTIEKITSTIDEETVEQIVVGLPRNLSGEETAQSAEVRRFAGELEESVECGVVLVDETLSTHAASELKEQFPKADIDSLAATVILGDYFNSL